MTNKMTDNVAPAIETQETSAQERKPELSWTPSLDTAGNVRTFDQYEAEIFRFALAQAGGCVSRAAELLQVGRATMYRKMRAYQIIAPPVSERAIDRTRRDRGDAKVEGEVEAAPQQSSDEVAA